jgi:hypothetical protein
MSRRPTNGTATVAEPAEVIGGREAKARELLARHAERVATLPALIREAQARLDEIPTSWARAGQEMPPEATAAITRLRTERDGLAAEQEAAPRVRAALEADVAAARHLDREAAAHYAEFRAHVEAATAAAEAVSGHVEAAVAEAEKRMYHRGQAAMLSQRYDYGSVPECRSLLRRGIHAHRAMETVRDLVSPLLSGTLEASRTA